MSGRTQLQAIQEGLPPAPKTTQTTEQEERKAA